MATVEQKTISEIEKLIQFVNKNEEHVDPKIKENILKLKSSTKDLINNLPELIRQPSGKWIIK